MHTLKHRTYIRTFYYTVAMAVMVVMVGELEWPSYLGMAVAMDGEEAWGMSSNGLLKVSSVTRGR